MKAILYRHALSFLLVTFLLSSCATMGVPVAETYRERLAAGYASVTGVRRGAVVLNDSKAISLEDAENVQKQADTVREGLDVASGLEGLPGAEDKLTSTITILEALKAYLKARGYESE